jgi:hypothetical protein
MAGKIRPLLAFWIGRDDVGLARVVWRQREDGMLGYELLVGTDPRLAPRSMNRWGYVAEERAGSQGVLLAMMSQSDERSYGEAKADVERNAGPGQFRAIEARVQDGVATSRVAAFRTNADLTIRDLQPLLTAAHASLGSSGSRVQPVARDVRPGFLGAVADLVDRTVQAARKSNEEPARVAGATIPYVFGVRTYDLRIHSVRVVDEQVRGGESSRPVLETAFEIHARGTDRRTRFDMTYATRGKMAGVPLTISWQPRWWLKVELHLDDARQAALAQPGLLERAQP